MITKHPLYLSALALTTFLAVGCQPPGPTVELPSPRFSGPTVQPKIAPTPAPQSASAWSAKSIPGVPGNWTPRTKPHAWKYIVIHHSATTNGSVASFDHEHKSKGWDGVGYHFVIGNGRGMSDGEIDPTPRWPIQKWGAHTKTANNEYNENGIGICLVGNFDVTRPSQSQLKSVSKLVAHLMKTYKISPNNVVGHGDCKPTDCPGRYTSVARIKQMATQQLAAGDTSPLTTDQIAHLSSTPELLQDAR
jgi:hypothetical protein